MLQISLYNQNGEETGKVDLNPALFAVNASQSVLHEAVIAQQANSRIVTAHTKDRGEVRGGGKKPWKQKGTGRARHGSIRSPLWKGGGVTFGPSEMRNFTKKINCKVRHKALAMALTDIVQNKNMFVVDSLVLPEFKTKTLSKILQLLPGNKQRTLVVVEEANMGVGIAASNLEKVCTLPVNCMNVVEVLKASRIVISKDALNRMNELFVRTKEV